MALPSLKKHILVKMLSNSNGLQAFNLYMFDLHFMLCSLTTYLHTTHRESPALATKSSFPRSNATTAVQPLSFPG